MKQKALDKLNEKIAQWRFSGAKIHIETPAIEVLSKASAEYLREFQTIKEE